MRPLPHVQESWQRSFTTVFEVITLLLTNRSVTLSFSRSLTAIRNPSPVHEDPDSSLVHLSERPAYGPILNNDAAVATPSPSSHSLFEEARTRLHVEVDGYSAATLVIYSSYDMVLQAMINAEEYDHPSLVLAYLHYDKEENGVELALRSAMRALNVGWKPLYSWDPSRQPSRAKFPLDTSTTLGDFTGP